MSRPLSSHSSQAQAPALAVAKSLNLKGCSHQLSSTALFVTNLRLLDFDLYEDWPEIAVHTFATRDAQQNQKKRIQCTEWALYRLFELWDPDETREVHMSRVSALLRVLMLLPETVALLPAPRASSVAEPARRTLPLPQ